VDELVISLAAKGLTTGEIAAHFTDVYGAQVSRDTISRITGPVLEEMVAWQSRPLDEVYPLVFVDAIHVKIRNGQVANRPIYTVIGVTVDGMRDILGLWIGDGGEAPSTGTKVLTESRNRGVTDVCILACDGLRGLVGTARVGRLRRRHLAAGDRANVRVASRAQHLPLREQGALVRARPRSPHAVHRLDRAGSEGALRRARGQMGERYPAIIRLWENAWAEFVPFLAYDPQIRTVLYSTNAIESVHARLRRSVRARYHFPTEQAAMKCLYLAVRSLDPTGRGQQRWSNRWKPALNAFAITFEGRLGNAVN
jgi:putative transposase